MRDLILRSMFLVLIGASTAFAANHSIEIGKPVHHAPNVECQVYSLSELTKDMLEDFFAGKTPGVVIECSQGAILPFSLSLKGEFLSLEESDTLRTIEVIKTCFIKFDKKTFLFSTNLQEWKDFKGFFTGRMGISLNVDQEVPAVDINIELNQRT